MKNFTKLATFLIVFLSFQVATGQNANYKGFELTGKNPLAIQVNQAFSKSSDVITFDGKIAAIYGLAVKANVTFNDSKSAVRIILTDNVGDEYLVYETYPMLEDGNSVTIDNLCEETGVLNGVTPRSLRVEVKNATVTIQSVTCSAASDQAIDIPRAKKEKKDLQNNSKINRLNKNIKAKGQAWVAGETGVSAMSYAAKKKLFGQSTFPAGIEYYVGGVLSAGDGLNLKSATATTMVENWDWRDRHGKNWITGVKNQGSCGSCWAFATTGATEAAVNLFYNQPLNMDLSEQNILSCSGAGSCTGGYPATALDYIKNTGIIDELAFPYSAADQACTNKSSSPTDQIKIGGRVDFGSTTYPVSDDNLKKMIIKYGPLSGGLLDWSHAMTLVGWRTVKDGDTFFCRDSSKALFVYPSPYGTSLVGKVVWIFKNSWGATWGIDGYVYVETTISNFAWTHAIVAPLTSLKQNYTVQCVDNDHDGYYWWGLGPKPANCPPCPDTPDGNDNDATLGPLDAYGNCIPISTISTSIPVANFSSDKVSLTAGGQVQFSDMSTNTPTSWSWTISGPVQMTSTAQNPSVVFSLAGVYSVTLTATNAFGQATLTKTNYITVAAPAIVADFTSDRTVVNEGQIVNFSDLSTGTPVSWSWTIPGGSPSTSSSKNPSVTYKTAGKYDVTLVVTDANGNSTKIKSAYINVNATVLTYAASHGNASKEWISKVALNGTTFSSSSTGTAGYADLTANTYNVASGKNYTMSLTPAYSGKANYLYWSVWIDFNHDYDFNDAGEQVLIISKSKTVISGSIAIPATALTGTTRMRISMKRDALPSANEVFAYGEVKDYTINISTLAASDNSFKSASIDEVSLVPQISMTVYPNPTDQIFNIKLSDYLENGTYGIYNLQGQKVINGFVESNNTQLDISNLPAGVYVVAVTDGKQVLKQKFIKKYWFRLQNR